MGEQRKAEWLKENAWTIVSIVVIGALILWWIVASIPPKVDTVKTSTDDSSNILPVSDLNPNGCYSAEKAKEHKNENACVDFLVGYTYESAAGNKFIDQYQDYASGFIVYIPSGSSANNVDLSQFNNKNIKVTGEIVDYNGSTEIIVTDLSQIKIYQ